MTSPLSEALDRAIPITQVGGLTRAIYPTTQTDADGWAVETPVIDAARILLAGSPIQWCEVHGDWSATFPFDGRKCRWALKVDGTKPCHITSMLLCTPPT